MTFQSNNKYTFWFYLKAVCMLAKTGLNRILVGLFNL